MFGTPTLIKNIDGSVNLQNPVKVLGAEHGIWTRTSSRSPDPKSGVSAVPPIRHIKCNLFMYWWSCQPPVMAYIYEKLMTKISLRIFAA